MEREIQIAGYRLIFMLILGMVLSMCRITGTMIGYAYSDPSQVPVHTILHPLAKVSIILGPITLLAGAAMLVGSACGMRAHRGTKPLPMAPMDHKVSKPTAYRPLDE